MSDPSFLYLQQWNKSRHIFRDIITLNEMAHSEMIGWFLSSVEGHEQGSYFIKNLFYKLNLENASFLSLEEIETISYENIIIDLEVSIGEGTAQKGRIDILIYDPITRYLFVLENKSEKPNLKSLFKQLKRYGDWAKLQVHNINKPIKPVFILLDLSDTASRDDVPPDWHITSYNWLEESIKCLLNRSLLSPENERLLRDYYIVISNDYSVDPQLECYKTHLAEIADRYPDSIMELTQQYGNYLPLDIKNHLDPDLTQFCLPTTLQRYGVIFLALLAQSRYELLKQELEIKLPNKYNFQYFKNGMRIYLLIMDSIKSDPNGFWPAYISIEQEESGFILKLTLCKRYTKEDFHEVLGDIANSFGSSIPGFIKNITLESFPEWDRDKIFFAIKKHMKVIVEIVLNPN